ncbi:MAG: hypothetical protein WB770_00455 [Acidimicrobiales bacterium]
MISDAELLSASLDELRGAASTRRVARFGGVVTLRGKARRGPTFRVVVLIHAVGRIVYAGQIDIQASWVKSGAEGLPQLLFVGCNDLGGTLMDENISRAAGAAHGQMVTAVDFTDLVEPLGRRIEQHTTVFGRPKVAA